MGDFIPQAKWFGSTPAVLHYNEVSRVMATIAVGWLRIPCLGYPDDIGIVAAESAIQGALAAFTDLNDIFGFELRIEAPQRGTQMEFRWVAVRFVAVDGVRQVHMPLPPNRFRRQKMKFRGYYKEKGRL